jgi:2-hydroxy-6-oxonona-2,4-dienedioate hydrolase
MSLWLEHMRGGRIAYHRAASLATRSLEAGDDGPHVVMLHGTWGHAEAYIRNVVPLGDRGYRVHAIDMIGHGLTDRPTDCDYRIGDYTDHVVAFLDAIGADQAHLVGESLGGWVAVRLALDAPERVSSVVNVVGGGLRPIPATPEELRGWAGLEERSREILDHSTFENWRKRMQWLVHNPEMMTDELVEVRAAINATPEALAASAKVYEAVAKMLREDLPGAISADEIASIRVPVFYLWTDDNPTTPASVAAAAHALTKVSKLHVMSNCGHWPQFESADEFNDLVSEYLATVND